MKALALLLFLVVVANVQASPPLAFNEHLGGHLPLGTEVIDETGHHRSLGALLDGRPTVLWFRYLRCPQLCSVIADGTVDSLRQLQMSAGRDFTVISVSIDPTDTTAMAASETERESRLYGRHGARMGWHTVTASEASIEALTAAAGFEYQYDPRSRQYAHPSGLLILTSDGRISSYQTGVDFAARDLSQALVRAREGQVGPTVYQLVINCLEGGLPQGRYGRYVWDALWISVVATLVVVFGGIGWMLAAEFRSRRRTSP